jgi:hypothetical protein
MADMERHERRPLWVRIAARAGTKRQTALVQVGGLVLLAGIGFLVAAVESGSSSFLGRLGLLLGLAGAGLCAGAALWSWLAVRWVDRNSKWA